MDDATFREYINCPQCHIALGMFHTKNGLNLAHYSAHEIHMLYAATCLVSQRIFCIRYGIARNFLNAWASSPNEPVPLTIARAIMNWINEPSSAILNKEDDKYNMQNIIPQFTKDGVAETRDNKIIVNKRRKKTSCVPMNEYMPAINAPSEVSMPIFIPQVTANTNSAPLNADAPAFFPQFIVNASNQEHFSLFSTSMI